MQRLAVPPAAHKSSLSLRAGAGACANPDGTRKAPPPFAQEQPARDALLDCTKSPPPQKNTHVCERTCCLPVKAACRAHGQGTRAAAAQELPRQGRPGQHAHPIPHPCIKLGALAGWLSRPASRPHRLRQAQPPALLCHMPVHTQAAHARLTRVNCVLRQLSKRLDPSTALSGRCTGNSAGRPPSPAFAWHGVCAKRAGVAAAAPGLLGAGFSSGGRRGHRRHGHRGRLRHRSAPCVAAAAANVRTGPGSNVCTCHAKCRPSGDRTQLAWHGQHITRHATTCTAAAAGGGHQRHERMARQAGRQRRERTPSKPAASRRAPPHRPLARSTQHTHPAPHLLRLRLRLRSRSPPPLPRSSSS